MNEQEDRYCIALQPICDSAFNHVADELLYRAHGGAHTADITDPLVATARACSAAFYEIGLSSLVGSRQLYLNVSRDWLNKPELMPLPPEQVVVELPVDLPLDEASLEQIRRVRERGYRVAADDCMLLDASNPLLPLLDVVKIDVRVDGAFDRAARFRSVGLKLIAAYIETDARLQACREQGFDLFQGYFYAFPEQVYVTQGKRSGNRAADMQLLRELFSEDPNLKRIESLLAQDPHLCALLFKRVNSAGEKRATRISRIDQAVMLLGFDKMRALTATLLLAHNQPVKRLLVFKALVRASMARRLAERFRELNPETAFTVGLFSLMDQLEGVSMERLLADIAFDEEVELALREQGGEMGKILRVIESFEQAHLDRRPQKLVEALNRDYLDSVAWTQEILSLCDE